MIHKHQHLSPATEFKKGENVGEKNQNWKGSNVGYDALHDWVRRWKGKASICVVCGSKKNVHWANKSHDYKRELDDFVELCAPCHKIYDSKAKGITFHKPARKWQAQIRFNDKCHYLGLFDTKEGAMRAYEQAKRRFGRIAPII